MRLHRTICVRPCALDPSTSSWRWLRRGPVRGCLPKPRGSGCAGTPDWNSSPKTPIDGRTGVEMVGREQGVPQAFEAAGGGGKGGVPKEVDHLTVNAKARLGRGGEAAHDGSDRFFKKIGVRLAVDHKLRQSFAGVAEDHAPIPHKLPDIESLFRKFSRKCPPMRRCGADDSSFAARECIAKVCAYRAGEDFVIFVKLDEMPVRGHTHIP